MQDRTREQQTRVHPTPAQGGRGSHDTAAHVRAAEKNQDLANDQFFQLTHQLTAVSGLFLPLLLTVMGADASTRLSPSEKLVLFPVFVLLALAVVAGIAQVMANHFYFQEPFKRGLQYRRSPLTGEWHLDGYVDVPSSPNLAPIVIQIFSVFTAVVLFTVFISQRLFTTSPALSAYTDSGHEPVRSLTPVEPPSLKDCTQPTLPPR